MKEASSHARKSSGELRSHDTATAAVGIARHGQLPRTSPVPTILKFIAAALAVMLVSGASVGAIALNGITSRLSAPEDIPSTQDGPLPAIGAMEGGFSVLIVGSDTREGQGGIGGEDEAGALNDVNMLLHVAGDQKSAVAISFPRDMVVDIPECELSDDPGSYKSSSTEPLNSALSYGGLGCVAQTIGDLTGLPIQFAGLITFNGVIAMTDAIGGVDVCVTGPVVDPSSQIDLPEAGTYTLQGPQALAFLRTRYGVGDGSDLSRISSQQVYLSSLVRTLKSSETLGDIGKVYALAQAAAGNMKLSSSLNNVTTMVQIALALKDIPTERVTFVQYPGTTGGTGIYENKVRPNEALGDELMALIATDQPFLLEESGDDVGSEPDPDAPVPVPDPAATPIEGTDQPVSMSIPGQTAAEYTCSVSNDY